MPLQVAAGVSVPALDKDANPVMKVDKEGKLVLARRRPAHPDRVGPG